VTDTGISVRPFQYAAFFLHGPSDRPSIFGVLRNLEELQPRRVKQAALWGALSSLSERFRTSENRRPTKWVAGRRSGSQERRRRHQDQFTPSSHLFLDTIWAVKVCAMILPLRMTKVSVPSGTSANLENELQTM
jgi:hypothetical protein